MKAQFVNNMRDILKTKVWNPSCVRLVTSPITSKVEQISCTFDTGNKTCILCAASEARDIIQKDAKDKSVYPIPLYWEIFPFFRTRSKSLYGIAHTSLALWQAEQLITELEQSDINF